MSVATDIVPATITNPVHGPYLDAGLAVGIIRLTRLPSLKLSEPSFTKLNASAYVKVVSAAVEPLKVSGPVALEANVELDFFAKFSPNVL